MRSLYPLIVFALALTTAATAHAQVVEVVPPATYVAPTPYVAPAPVYASPTTTYYGGATYPYVTRYAPSATFAPSYPYQTWLAPRPIYYGAMRPIAPVRRYIW
jgi:hypothetical protein